MIIFRFIIFFSLIICAACDLNDNKNKANIIEGATAINLQPFENISQTQVNYIANELRKLHNEVRIKKKITLPATAYVASRKRYRADSLIRFLQSQTPIGEVTVGMTDLDISTTKGEIADYGIMGLGYKPGRACVVSTFRLSKTNLSSQYFKVTIHELGHTEGLPHCVEKFCFMRDAKGKNHTDEETQFCQNCTRFLQSHGWKL